MVRYVRVNNVFKEFAAYCVGLGRCDDNLMEGTGLPCSTLG